MPYALHGFAIFEDVLTKAETAVAGELVRDVIERYRLGEAEVRRDGISIEEVSRQHPSRNPGIVGRDLEGEPYIIGNLLALNPRFAQLFSTDSLWQCASNLLECAPDEVVFHLSNVTRKPARIGPAVGWHRDADNTYCATSDRRTVRLLLPLQTMSRANGGTELQVGSHMANAVLTDELHGSVCCPVVPHGSCLAIHSETLHGGGPNRSAIDRDVLVVQFGVLHSTLTFQCNEALSGADRCQFDIFNTRYKDLEITPT